MSTGSRPRPVPDELSATYWTAAEAHSLVLARCSRCQQFTHPPDTVCPHCGSTDPEFSFDGVDGSGTVRSWTVVRQSFLPGFDVPFVLADVELGVQEGLRLIGRLVDGPNVAVRVGDPVRLVFEDIGDDLAIPAFALETGA